MYIKGTLIFIVCILLSGCSSIRQKKVQFGLHHLPNFYIERVMDDGVIACEGETCNTKMSVRCWHLCSDINDYRLYVERHLRVFFDKIEGLDYRSGYFLKFPKNVNFEKKGVFEYTDEYGVKRKILHLAIVKDSKNNNRI